MINYCSVGRAHCYVSEFKYLSDDITFTEFIIQRCDAPKNIELFCSLPMPLEI